MARSTLTATIQRVQALAEQVQSLPPEEYHYFLDLIDPQPEPATPAKKSRKKRGQRTPRAESLSNVISKPPKAERSADPCVYQYPDDSPVTAGMVCGEFFENGIHDQSMAYAGYHEFEAPKSKKAAAQK